MSPLVLMSLAGVKWTGNQALNHNDSAKKEAPGFRQGPQETIHLFEIARSSTDKNTTPAGNSCTHASETLGEQWGTVNGLATKYGCHPNTLRNWIQSGKLSATRFGDRMIRVRESDLQDLLKPYENGQAGPWARQGL